MNREYYLALYQLLKNYQKAYEQNQPVITDDHYDLLYAELKKLEEQFGQIANDSPTNLVGYKDNNRSYVTHLKPMLSLEHELGIDGLNLFLNKINRFLNTNNFYTLIAQPKIDGVSVALRYKSGFLQTAALRGDGFEGEDITANILAMDLPPKLKIYDWQDFEIRGELYMPLSIYNNEFSQEFASARHAVSGAVRLLDTTEFKRRKIGFLAHGFAMLEYDQVDYSDVMKQIEQYMPIVPQEICANEQEAMDNFDYWLKQRDKQDFLMDGIVYKINDMKLWQALQYSAKAPRYAFALKFSGNKAISEVEDVNWSVGRTGVITPVLEIKPVEIDGVNISRVTLHNASEFLRWNVVKGDKALIERAFDVIPAVIEIIKIEEDKAELPKKCPSCESELILDDKFLLCKNGWNCAEQVIDRLFHCLSRDAFDIEGLGQQKLAFLYDKNLLKYPADIFKLEENCAKVSFDLMAQEGWGKKSVEKLFANIKARKEIRFNKFLYSLGIDGLGKSLAAKISQYCNSWNEFVSYAYKDLIELDGIGEIIVNNIQTFIEKEKTWIEELNEVVTILPNLEQTVENQIYVVFTGTFNVSRQALKQALNKFPQIMVGDSVTKKTNILIYGQDPGSKLKKAKEAGLQCMNENEWNEYVGTLNM